MAEIYLPGVYYSAARVVQEKGDIQDLITNLDIRETPMYSTLKHRKVQDANPKTLTDSLLSVVTTARAYGSAAISASDTARAVVQNWCQRMSVTISVSDEQDATAQYGMGKETSYQNPKKLAELKRSIEAVLISDQVRQAPTAANLNVGEMDGMSTIIASHTNATFSQANYDVLVAACAADGGRPTMAYMDSTRKIAVDAWTTTPTRFSTEITKLEKEVRLYHSSLGEVVQMHWHYLMPSEIDGANGIEFMAIDPSLWEVCDFLRMFHENLAVVGGSTNSQWVWNGSILCRAEEGNLMTY